MANMNDLPDDNPVRSLYETLRELHQDGGSSNDWVQAVDDWFVQQGYPTIIYQ